MYERSRQQSRLRMAILFALFLSAGLLSYDLILDGVCAPSRQALECKSVDLGDFRPNEKREIVVQIRNKGFRTLALRPPRSSCGCMSMDDESVTLLPFTSHDISFEITVASLPGKFRRSILLQSRDFPDLNWQVEVRGEVVAQVWAQPTTLELCSQRDKVARGSVAIHTTRAGCLANFIEIEAVESGVEFSLREAGEDILWIDSIFRPDNTTSPGQVDTLSLRDVSDGAELLRIPVKWRPQQPYECVPRRIDLGDLDSQSAQFTRTVLIAMQSPDVAVQIVELEKWAKIVEKETDGQITRLTIQFHTHLMPRVVGCPILELVTSDGESTYLRVFGKHSN